MKNRTTFRVIYKDTDAEGVVYYANYLGWFEAGRGELLREHNISLTDLKNKENLVFAVRDLQCEYLKPAVYDDEIIVETEIANLSPARIVFSQKIIRKKDSEILTQATTTLFPINLKTFKPTRMPESVSRQISEFISMSNRSQETTSS